MSSLFQSLKDKAQTAVNQSGLADRIPGGHFRTSSADASHGGKTSPPPQQGQPSGGLSGFTKSHTFESIQHQFRTFQQQYSSSTTPVRKIITSAKGAAIGFDAVSRDLQAHSKEVYLWGQTESSDIKDVTDRLGWLNYVHGSLSSYLASKVNTARSPFKAYRDAENAFAPRRNLRTGLETQIDRIENEHRKDQLPKLPELRAQLQKMEEEDEPAEKELELLMRKAIRESEQLKWEAVREYAEKLTMVAQAALEIVPVLPATPPSATHQYAGAQTTASVRASLQKALDNYSPGNVSFITGVPSASDLKHTRSFGETHAQELSRIGQPEASNANLPLTPPLSGVTVSPPVQPTSAYPPSFPQPMTSSSLSGRPSTSSSSPPATAPSPHSLSPPLNPSILNQAPAPIPATSQLTSPVAAPDPADPSTKVPSVTPTVAETGVPLQSSGPEGPGPASGSLLDKKPSTASSAHYETAEEEKRRLEREERERVLRGSQGPTATPKYESAEEEKKRLEREERERVLRQGGSGSDHPPPKRDQDPDGDGELPPYQEF